MATAFFASQTCPAVRISADFGEQVTSSLKSGRERDAAFLLGALTPVIEMPTKRASGERGSGCVAQTRDDFVAPGHVLPDAPGRKRGVSG
jgi:hypothetical protein